jgi:hypothetical protein
MFIQNDVFQDEPRKNYHWMFAADRRHSAREHADPSVRREKSTLLAE